MPSRRRWSDAREHRDGPHRRGHARPTAEVSWGAGVCRSRPTPDRSRRCGSRAGTVRDRPYEARGKLFPCDVRGRRTGFRGRTLEAVPQRGSVSVAAGDAAAVSCSTAGSLGFLLGAISGASRTGAPCGCVLADSREVRFRGVASRDSGVSSRVPHGDRAGGRGSMGGTHSALRYELRAAERDGLASLAAVGDRERGLGPSLDLTRDGACCVRERETPRTTFQARAWVYPAAAAYLVADAPGGRALGR